MELQDLITILLFIIPGWISLYIIKFIVGYEHPRNNFDKLINYVFHNVVVLSLLGLYCKFVLKEEFVYGLNNFLYILPFAFLWALIFIIISWILNKYNLIPNGLKFNSNVFREIHHKWFKDGYARIRLKSGVVLKGWIYATNYYAEDNKFYLVLAKYKRLSEDQSKDKLNYNEIYKPKDYQVILIDYDNVDYIEYSHKRMKEKFKN